MATLNEILAQSMLMVAAQGAAKKPEGKIPAPLPTPSPKTRDAILKELLNKYHAVDAWAMDGMVKAAEAATEANAIWHFKPPSLATAKRGGQDQRVVRVDDLTCFVREMKYEMAMPVTESIEWGPVAVRFNGNDYALPLTADYLIRTSYLKEGKIAEDASEFWKLAALTDQSFQMVFGYDIPLMGSESSMSCPRDAADIEDAEFMPDEPGLWTALLSPSTEKTTHNMLSMPVLRVVVCVSLVLCKEKADFDPGGALGSARLYPLIMILANMDLQSASGEVRIARPATAPQCHMHAGGERMTPEMHAEFFTDSNRSMDIPPLVWDEFFDYYWIDPKPQEFVMVDPSAPARTITGAVHDHGWLLSHAGFGAMIAKDSRIPRKVVKVKGQGEFDNVHIAPKMLPPASIKNPDPTMKEIAMAPFCVHDCLHTHWRWGKGLGEKQNRGWDGFTPYAVAGAPLVPGNQTIKVELLGPNSFRYAAQAAGPKAAQWQVMMHHGSGYAVSKRWKADLARAGLDILTYLGQIPPGAGYMPSAPSESPGESFWPGEPSDSWAMFYWHLRYAYKLGHGVLERLEIDLDKARK